MARWSLNSLQPTQPPLLGRQPPGMFVILEAVAPMGDSELGPCGK